MMHSEAGFIKMVRSEACCIKKVATFMGVYKLPPIHSNYGHRVSDRFPLSTERIEGHYTQFEMHVT